MNALCVGGPKDGLIIDITSSYVSAINFPVFPELSVFDLVNDSYDPSRPSELRVDVYYNTRLLSNSKRDTFIFIWDKL